MGFRFHTKDRWGDTYYEDSLITFDRKRIERLLDLEKSKYYGNRNLESYKNFCSEVDNFDDNYLFIKYKTPIFVINLKQALHTFIYDYSGSPLIINPVLKDIGFQKVVDSWTTFQEIQMFISGVLGTGENDTIEVSEDVKIKQHGFDKWSFRRPPEE